MVTHAQYGRGIHQAPRCATLVDTAADQQPFATVSFEEVHLVSLMTQLGKYKQARWPKEWHKPRVIAWNRALDNTHGANIEPPIAEVATSAEVEGLSTNCDTADPSRTRELGRRLSPY